MKVCFQVEGPLDRRVLVDLSGRILRQHVDPVVYQRRAGGLDEVLRTLEASIWYAWTQGCIGAVVGVDANGTAPHALHGPEAPGDCRRCAIGRRLPKLPTSPDSEFRFAIAVPVQAIEAWLLHFGHLVDRRPTGPPQDLDRREAKRLLWGNATPTRAQVDSVCGAILTRLSLDDLEALASSQPSFAEFRTALGRWA